MKRHVLAMVALAMAAGCDEADEVGDGAVVAPSSIEFTVRIEDATTAEPTFLEGVEICAAEHPEIACATTDASGAVTLELPVGAELMLRCESDTHGPAYMTWTIGAEDIDAGTFGLIDKTKMELLMQLAGAKAWPEKGAITVNVYEDLIERDVRVAGATFTIEPNGSGPVYVSEQKLPAPPLEATTIGGPGVFFDVDGGEVVVTIDHPDRPCVGGFGWKTESEASLRSKIFPGGLSNVTFVCPP